MTPETEVIACPACKHLVRVPLDWLGTEVQCPECKAKFRAPTRVDGKLTAAELLSRPGAPAEPKPRTPPDLMLMLPAFGLLVIGFAGLVVGAFNTVRYARDATEPARDVLRLYQEARKLGVLTDGPPEPAARAQFDEARAAEQSKPIRVLVPVFVVVSGLVFYGGVAIVTRRHYRMAQLGCALAVVNIANGCFIPGAVAGLWGLLMLGSDEGRAHFQK